MSLWVDKYRPNALTKLEFHSEINERLQLLARSEEIPHLLVYGPSGAGKKTRVLCLLREIYGSGVDKKKLENRSIKTSSGRTVEITTLGSNHHIECNPSDAGSYDRFVIQDVIKEIASHQHIASTGPGARSFKIVVLSEVDKLSKQAQAGLRRTMEKYSSACRVILLCNSSSKVIEPIRSRCLGIRIPSPSPLEITDLLTSIAKKEAFVVSSDFLMSISVASNRNIRKAILMLEAAKVQGAPSVMVTLPDWELYIGRIAQEILSEQSPSKLQQVREMFYELLTNCIPADVIIKTLTQELFKALDDTLKHELTFWASYYDHRLRQGSKDIFHLEAFVAKFMAIYKKWLIAFFC